MPDLLAKGVAAAVAALLAVALGILFYTSQPQAGETEVVAEFDNAFPLIEGMHVRVDGAITGSVSSIEVNERGNAEVKLSMNGSVTEPMGDASAAIRQQDTTGDSYVAFDPGGDEGASGSDEPLGEEGLTCDSHDVCSRTLVAPRLDDLLNAFGPAERSGLQLILVELAKAMDRRGDGLNEAALELRPAFEAANSALAQLREQNQALQSMVRSTESVTGQAAERSRELGRLVESLATTATATANGSAALDAGLERLPKTAAEAQTTLAALTRTALAARPLADDLAEGAPDLATALGRLPAFLDDASGWIEETKPTLELTRKLFRAAQPALEVGAERVITGPFDLTGATADLLNSVLGGEDAFPALFGDDSYGEGEGTLGKRGFGAVAVEPGNLPGYPESHAPRNWLRVSAVINCEVFGRPVEPGCLADVLSGAPLPLPAGEKDGDEPGVDRRLGGRSGRPDVNAGSRKGGGSRLPDLERSGREGLGLPGGGGSERGGRKGDGGKRKKGAAARLGPSPGLRGLLDFLTSDG